MSSAQEINVEGRKYNVTFERRIARAQREVVATAYNLEGVPVAQELMNTSAARSFLGRDSEGDPPDWEELERIALDMLKLGLEE